MPFPLPKNPFLAYPLDYLVRVNEERRVIDKSWYGDPLIAAEQKMFSQLDQQLARVWVLAQRSRPAHPVQWQPTQELQERRADIDRAIAANWRTSNAPIVGTEILENVWRQSPEPLWLYISMAHESTEENFALGTLLALQDLVPLWASTPFQATLDYKGPTNSNVFYLALRMKMLQEVLVKIGSGARKDPWAWLCNHNETLRSLNQYLHLNNYRNIRRSGNNLLPGITFNMVTEIANYQHVAKMLTGWA